MKTEIRKQLLVRFPLLSSSDIDEVLQGLCFFRGQDLVDSADEAGCDEYVDEGVECVLPDGSFFHGYFREGELVFFGEV